MPKGQKYINLTNYLKEINLEVVEMTFDQLEKVMNEKIPDSIFKYKTFGSNFDHSFSYGWSLAGYSAKADFDKYIVTFRKDNSGKQNIESKSCSENNFDTKDIKILDFYHEIQLDENNRYKSWEHCYNFFISNRKKEIPIANFSLHLFAYLASWGMLRGSSFLLQKDYLFHNEVVQEILNKKYDCLVGINPQELDDKKIYLILELCNNISQIYFKKTFYIGGKPYKNTYPSNTLLTKILLGTLGCTPAYDRYFTQGIKCRGLNNKRFSYNSVQELREYYLYNKDIFDEIQIKINSNGLTKYPIMKLLDMHFWQIGYSQ